MNQETISTNKTINLLGILSVIAISGLCLFMLNKINELLILNDKFLVEMRGTREGLSQLDDKLSLFKPSQSCSTSDSEVSRLVTTLRAELAPFAQRLEVLETSMLGNQSRNAVKPRSNISERPTVLPKLMPPPMGSGTDENLQFGGEGASLVSREQMEQLFSENAERVRERIAAETDPQNPDPDVLDRIMEQSQEELALKLQGILPQEEIQVLFPPRPPRFDWYSPRQY